ncbi:hypothetical protein NDU88_006316 [Pleurodeles waltl]|uniref:Uncharacterized protein n=1 Tax=Pleurodeles waltl TaxID=8319 RepID=A0AAV7VQN7_PLEWA|nr:hypothetical protein NDU88_006316 [Pleurodeles waltl]
MARPDARAAPAVPGVRGPGSGPPILQAALPRPDGPRPGWGVWGGFPGRSGAQGPRVGPSHPPGCPSPMGPGPGVRRVRGGLPGRSGWSGAPGRALQPALPRWAPARVSGGSAEASPAAPGGQGPRVGPSSLPFPDGPRPRCPGAPGRPPRPHRVVRGPGRALQPALPRWAPARVSGAPGRALQPALPRWAPAGPPGTPSAPRAPRAKAECVQMAALRARPSGLTENPGHLVALRAGLLWRVQMAGLPRKSR